MEKASATGFERSVKRFERSAARFKRSIARYESSVERFEPSVTGFKRCPEGFESCVVPFLWSATGYMSRATPTEPFAVAIQRSAPPPPCGANVIQPSVIPYLKICRAIKLPESGESRKTLGHRCSQMKRNLLIYTVRVSDQRKSVASVLISVQIISLATPRLISSACSILLESNLRSTAWTESGRILSQHSRVGQRVDHERTSTAFFCIPAKLIVGMSPAIRILSKIIATIIYTGTRKVKSFCRKRRLCNFG